MRASVIAPDFSCKDCLDRSPGCHGSCKKYQAEKSEYDAQKTIVDSIDRDYRDYRSNSIIRNMDYAAKKSRRGFGNGYYK